MAKGELSPQGTQHQVGVAGLAADKGEMCIRDRPEALYSQLQRQVLTAERACLAADRRIASVSDEMCIRDSYWADSSPFPPSSISRP